MDEIIQDLLHISERFNAAAVDYKHSTWFREMAKLSAASDRIKQSHSGSWLGRQATYYYKDFIPAPSEAFFSVEWGYGRSTRGEWQSYSDEEVIGTIYKFAGLNPPLVDEISYTKAYSINRSLSNEMKSVFSSLESASTLDSYTQEAIAQGRETKFQSAEEYKNSIEPLRIASRDSESVHQGIRTPGYVKIKAAAIEVQSLVEELEHRSLVCLDLAKHLQRRKRMTTTTPPAGHKVFIGHGRSSDWRILKDFLQDRLGLIPDEFNRSPSAGMTTKERLDEMLNDAAFALLVMTAEDELADGKTQARMNVIHEIGLFQGRLGFRKAIVLMEEGCEEFSNIAGLVQVRYSKGNIRAAFEEIRQVLERENIIK